MVIGGSDIRSREAAHAADIVDAPNGGRHRSQKQISDSIQIVVDVGNVGVLPVVVEITSALRRLRDVTFKVVDLKTRFECMIAENLGYTVGSFNAPDILKGRCVIAHANVCQPIDRGRGQASVIGDLGIPLMPYCAGMPKVFP